MNQSAMPPVDVMDLFPEVREGGVRILQSLSEQEWRLPTACAGWSVHDVALHIGGGLLANVSRRRDQHVGNFREFEPPNNATLDEHERLIHTLNGWNEMWVLAGRRISPALLIEIIDSAGCQLEEYFRRLDFRVLGDPVGWAGLQPAPVWLDVAREYTELWTHLAQIREATGRAVVDAPHLLAPVLATFAHGIPHALRSIDRPMGATLTVVVHGEAGGQWWVKRAASGWELHGEVTGSADAVIDLDQVTAWRLATKGMSRDDARREVNIKGDIELGEGFLNLVAILA
ncbi:MAG TPA: maleylpyruvate isomerase N-terminal domain-containing protein [Thermomicrobiales bacterium]|nr:maleylpyruvate isomerase N-terminal domain-containing protein [Thermomicrobiales bacterium]